MMVEEEEERIQVDEGCKRNGEGVGSGSGTLKEWTLFRCGLEP